MAYRIIKQEDTNEIVLLGTADTKDEAVTLMEDDFFDDVRNISSKHNNKKTMEVYNFDGDKCFIEYTLKKDGSRHSIRWQIEDI